ncbi:MAG: hypothetical protein FD189_979 [Elusimicrobia bacterium]|nr:MAG: hypothetical protein FD154_1220 [Elusimicrobiota bacterium]KAF0156426.1 MAG: hypothetical protein FD189_979 [Elusimicrobiota bacterium]
MIKFNRARFWIRKDRESYFLPGVLLAAVIGGFVSSYWHFTDILSTRPAIRRSATAPPSKSGERIRDTQLYTAPAVSTTRYYQVEEHLPRIPDLPEDAYEGE